MSTDYFCPILKKWNEIYGSLLMAWKKKGRNTKDKPLVPQVLAAWHETIVLQYQIAPGAARSGTAAYLYL